MTRRYLNNPASILVAAVCGNLIEILQPEHLPSTGLVPEIHAESIAETVGVVEGDGTLLLPRINGRDFCVGQIALALALRDSSPVHIRPLGEEVAEELALH